MKYEWDEAKRCRNLEWHGVDFSAAERFDWSHVIVRVDNRKDYGEARFFAIAPIGERLYSMVYTLRGQNIRIISLRKSNPREIRNYEKVKN